MAWFVIAIILAVAGVVAVLIAKGFKPTSEDIAEAKRRYQTYEPSDLSGIIRWCGAGAIALALVIVGFDSTTTVKARTVGVETSFGKPVSALPNGFHLVRPWAAVDDSWDGTIQTDQYDANVRLANGTIAPLQVRVQYQIDTGAKFLPLWRSYKNFDKIKVNVVELNTTNALNQIFEAFNPLTSLDTSGTQTVTVSSFAPPALLAVRQQMPAGLTILKLTIPTITYNKVVQEQIDNIVSAAAQTRVAVQNEQTAKATAAGNDALAAGNTSPGVLYAQCLSMTNTWMKAGETPPPGWSCGNPAAQVVIPTK